MFYQLHQSLAVHSSGIHGRGTFATCNLSKGTLLIVIGGQVLTVLEEAELPQTLQDLGVQISPDLVLSPGSSEFVGGINNINHCCDPNAGFHGQIFLVAIRDIICGEEITLDYAMCLHPAPGVPRYELQCRCGTPHCRKRITEDDWKIPELQRRYNGYFQWYLQEKINAGKKGEQP
jgi:hypothetical protein